MAKISEMLERLPSVKAVHMSSNGIALWVYWDGEADSSIVQILQDYGGMHICSDRNQALWFFFNIDVMLALARLFIWAKYNPLSIGAQAFPARLLLSVSQEQTLSIDNTLRAQEIVPPKTIQVWIHPKVQEQAINIPGLSFIKSPRLPGMGSFEWTLLEADIRLPYTSSQGWYALVHPLGNQLDKNFQEGWGYMFSRLDEIIQKYKFKDNSNDTFVMVSLENLRALRTWAREFIVCVNEVKSQRQDTYWPCVSVIVDRRGLNLNNDLPGKVGINWNHLIPDYPYVSYRNAYLMGEGFILNELHFSSANATMDSWCTLSLGENAQNEEYVPILVAGHLIAGDKSSCFYCGARGHSPAECPTRKLKNDGENVWSKFGDLSLDSINESFREIDSILTEQGLNGYETILSSESQAALLLKACFEADRTVQLREAERLWMQSASGRSRESLFGMNDNEDVDISRPPATFLGRDGKDDSPLWILFERFLKPGTDLAKLEKDIQAAIARSTRDWRLRTLLGFVLMEKGDSHRAMNSWREGESLSSSTTGQVWHQFLQGRMLEILGRDVDAQEVYQSVLRLVPNWLEPEYRLIVCRVKMGFAEQVQQRMLQLISKEPRMFNRFLVDPELERGHIILLTALYPLWSDALQQAADERSNLERLQEELNSWFPEDHPMAFRFNRRINALRQLSGVTNYMACLQVIKDRPDIEKEILQQIQKEIEQLQETYKGYLSALEIIRDEISWFPLPRILVEFNRNFNECAGIINWAFGANFHETESFKRAQAYIPTITDLIKQLEERLRFLRVVRDSTLFVLILLRTFFWLEVAGVALCLIVVPLIAVYGDAISLGWLKNLVRTHHWELQKVLVTIVSIMALGASVLRTTLIFDRRRDRLLASAKQEREEMQQKRLDKVREARRKQVEQERNKRRSPFDNDM